MRNIATIKSLPKHQEAITNLGQMEEDLGESYKAVYYTKNQILTPNIGNQYNYAIKSKSPLVII